MRRCLAISQWEFEITQAKEPIDRLKHKVEFRGADHVFITFYAFLHACFQDLIGAYVGKC